MISIDAGFDGGNIEILAAEQADDIRLRIRADNRAAFRQWFSFRLHGGEGADCVLRLVNASECSYPGGWNGYRAVASADGAVWRRVETGYADGVLTIRHRPAAAMVAFAYFAPYPMDRHAGLIARAAASPLARHEVLGTTPDGADLDLLTIGAGRLPVWVMARQHPGETMAEWFAEGLVERLLDPADPPARALRQAATVHIVPNMNPDGSRRGNLRTNALGANLNREWADPDPGYAPEVWQVRRRMEETGVALCLDAHGDETLPYCFIVGFDGIPAPDPGRLALLERFKAALAQANPDFQTEHGYPRLRPGQANPGIATSQIAQRFGAVAMTLEMPFKDPLNAPEPAEGWSPSRSRVLARSCVEILPAILADLPVPPHQ